MSEEKFEDTRNSIRNLLNHFQNNEILITEEFERFERKLNQIINIKSTENFELFLYTFDLIFEKKISSRSIYVEYIQSEMAKENKNTDKAIRLYYKSFIDEEGKEETLKLVFEIYGIHRSILKYYSARLLKLDLSEFTRIPELQLKKDYDNISFDIFLSHRYYLKFYNIVVYYILTVYYKLNVYVDWIFDYEVDRKELSEDTVRLLSKRMVQSNKLLFFNIKSSQTTNWMAWEVGYFSAYKKNSIGILDLDGYCKGNKNVEVLSSNDILVYDDSKGIVVKNSLDLITNWARL